MTTMKGSSQDNGTLAALMAAVCERNGPTASLCPA